ncbi:MAG: hypothetical protein SNH79_03075 [Rikenellaceae bacterium]
MKRVIFMAVAALCAVCSVSTASAKVFNGEKNTVGIRLTHGVEATYQRYLSDENRIEATLGLGGYGFDASATYQRVFDLADLDKGGFNWYVGGGAVLGAWTKSGYANGFSLGVAAQAGVEWGFKKVPVVISLDYRPTLYFIPDFKFHATGFGLSARYAF